MVNCGCSNWGIVIVLIGGSLRVVEGFGLDANVLMVDIQSFRNTVNWRAKVPVSFLEVVREAR